MYKKILAGILCIALLSVLLVACNITDASNLPKGPQVQMGGSTFIQTTVNVKKGQTLTLIDSTASPHVIVNGTWKNGAQKPVQEPGAPTVNLNFVGSDTHATAPFTTAGTYLLYCTVHQGMNLTVIVA